MLTAQLTPRTFLIGSTTYEVGKAIDLTPTERENLHHVARLTEDINVQRVKVFDQCFKTTVEVDAELAQLYFDFENLRFAHSTESTALLRTICARLGGVLPLSLVVNKEPYRVEVRALQQGESLTIGRDIVANGSRYSQAIGDIEAMLPVFLGTEDRSALVHGTSCNPADWLEFGCPYVLLPTADLGLDLNYADGLTQWTWADHENREVDRLVTHGIGRALGQAGRIQAIQSRTAPLPMIGVVVGPHATVLMNLTESTEPHDVFRLELIRRTLAQRDGRALFLVQYGPLDQRSSAVDMQQGAQQPQGITVSAAIRNDCGVIIGGKSWTIQQQTPQTPPSLMTYGVFEDTPGLAGDGSDQLIRNLFAGLPSLDKPALALVEDAPGTGDQCQEAEELVPAPAADEVEQ